MPPARTETRPARTDTRLARTRARAPRFSSPTLPASPLPPSSDPNYDEQEEERTILNRVVCRLRDIANDNMVDYPTVLTWYHASKYHTLSMRTPCANFPQGRIMRKNTACSFLTKTPKL